MELLVLIADSLKHGYTRDIRKYVGQALEAGIDQKSILDTMLSVMDEVGKKFKANQLFVPEVLIIGRAFNAALELLSPFNENEDLGLGTVVIGTVKGDLHDIGKNLVKMLISGAGVHVIDLTVDVSPAEFVEAIRKYDVDIVAMSALLTTTMVQIQQTIKEIEKAGLRDEVKVLIGGAPVTKNYADNIGADFYASDAGSAAELVREYLQKRRK